LIQDYFSTETREQANTIKQQLIEIAGEDHRAYMDTLISPSFTSAIAQTIQLPGVSGMPNNMILFEFDKETNDGVVPILENILLAKAARLDVCVLASTNRKIIFKHGIHVWIRSSDFENSNLMILLSYIMLGHPDWKKGKIKIFEIARSDQIEESRAKLTQIIQSGRLPISPKNIEIIASDDNVAFKHVIDRKSADAGLTVIGFREEQAKHDPDIFSGYDELGDILFVNASQLREIN
jgi:hypothetical protein